MSEFSDKMENEPERVVDGGAEETVSQISTTTSFVSTLQPTKMLDIHTLNAAEMNALRNLTLVRSRILNPQEWPENDE